MRKGPHWSHVLLVIGAHAISVCALAAHQAETFSEELLLRPLPDGSVSVSVCRHHTTSAQWAGSMRGPFPDGERPPESESGVWALWMQAHFHFELEADVSRFHTLFPRSVDQLVGSTGVREFHLSLTQGRWVRTSTPLQATPCRGSTRQSLLSI